MKKRFIILLEIAFIFLTVSFYVLLKAWIILPPGNNFEISLFLVAYTSVITLLIIVFRKIWKAKWRERFKKFIKYIYESILSLLLMFHSKFFKNFSFRKKKGNELASKAKITFNFRSVSRKSTLNIKTINPKWSRMNTVRERLGFLYYKIITKKINSGVKIYPHNTPLEIRLMEGNSILEEEILDLYISTRYDERVCVSPDKVNELKGKLGIK